MNCIFFTAFIVGTALDFCFLMQEPKCFAQLQYWCKVLVCNGVHASLSSLQLPGGAAEHQAHDSWALVPDIQVMQQEGSQAMQSLIFRWAEPW